MIVIEKFIDLLYRYGEHVLYTDKGTWYHEKGRMIELKHYLHSPLEKSLIKRVNQYFKDRIESFNNYYPLCNKKVNAIYSMYKLDTILYFNV